MKQIYTVGIYLFSFAVRVYSLFNAKSRRMLNGHKQTIELFKQKCNEEYIWFHAASLGEFEQGKPLIERFKKDNPNQKILLTFFSPSGYEVRKDYENADLVLYLPFDTPKNVSGFLNSINIKTAIFIKYEFWFNYLGELQNRNIPIFYVSAIFRSGQKYFKNNWMLNNLKKVDFFFVQNEESKVILQKAGISKMEVTGDTRFDSVIYNAKQNWNYQPINDGLDGRPVIIFGSTWSKDHELIIEFINLYKGKYQYIIAPHNIKESEILSLSNQINLAVSRYSSEELLKDVMIVDTIGVLKYIYKYADVAYIGGGFNNGIHNTLEPIVYNMPVVFGPEKVYKFQEALNLIKEGIGFQIKNQTEFSSLAIKFLDNQYERSSIEERVKSYLAQNEGATEKIFDRIKSMTA